MTDKESERRFERMDAYLERAAARDAESRSRHTGVRRAWPAPPLDVLLDFEERNPFPMTAQKGEAIRRTFGGMTVKSYIQHLNRAIDLPEALAMNPQLVNRLRARRQRMTDARAARTFPNRSGE